MGGIADRIQTLKRSLPAGVSLVAVSKTRSLDEIMEAYNAGQRLFGENRVQELANKAPLLPVDIEWHLIGHLQTNKVRQVIRYVSMIESVDSLRLLSVISSEAVRAGRVTDCLLQVHIAEEEAKSGFDRKEIEQINWSEVIKSVPGVRIRGLMGIATFTEDEQKIRSEFGHLAALFSLLKTNFPGSNRLFNVLSMGMSGDWRIAVSEGSTMIRVGTIIFGERIKH